MKQTVQRITAHVCMSDFDFLFKCKWIHKHESHIFLVFLFFFNKNEGTELSSLAVVIVIKTQRR